MIPALAARRIIMIYTTRWPRRIAWALVLGPQIGIGAGSPPRPCHTTVHAGPHTAVRRIELRPHDHGWKPELGKVGFRQSNGQGGRVRNPPRAVRTPGSGCREIFTDAPLAKFPKPCPSSFPL